jgi:hypothetical protein
MMSHSMLSDRSLTTNLSLEKMAVKTGGKQNSDIAGADTLSARLHHLVATGHTKNEADEEEHQLEEKHQLDDASVVASRPSAMRTTNKAAAKSKWQGIQLLFQESRSVNLSVLRQEITQLRDISLECRHENEELLQDAHALFDENADLSEEVQSLKQDKSGLQQKNSALTEKLESALFKLEEKDQLIQQGLIANPFAGVVGLCRGITTSQRSSSIGGSAISSPAPQSSVLARGAASNESDELLRLQLQCLKAELKRERRRWDTEQRAMNEQYKKDRFEKDALRDVAREYFVKLKQVQRENKNMQKKIQPLPRFAVAATAAVPETAAAPEQKQSQGRWSFVPGAMRNHEGMPSSTSRQQPHMGRQCDREEPPTGSAMELISAKEDDGEGSSSEPQEVDDDDQSLSLFSVEESVDDLFSVEESDDEFDTDFDANDSQDFHESLSQRMMELSMSLSLRDSEDQAGHAACTLLPPALGSLPKQMSELEEEEEEPCLTSRSEQEEEEEEPCLTSRSEQEEEEEEPCLTSRSEQEEEEEEPCLTSTSQHVKGGVCGPVGTDISATSAANRPRRNTGGRWFLPCMLPDVKDRNKGDGQGIEEDDQTQASNASRLSRAISLPSASSPLLFPTVVQKSATNFHSQIRTCVNARVTRTFRRRSRVKVRRLSSKTPGR